MREVLKQLFIIYIW